MNAWGIAALCLLGLAVLIFAASYVCMRLACRCYHSVTADLEKNLNRPEYREFKVQILKGRDWIDAQQPETVEITSFDGLRLRAELIVHPQACGTLMLFHGWYGSTVTDFGFAIQEYYDRNLNLLLVHQRAQGKSEGRYMTFGIRERHDVHAWTKWHAARFGQELPILLAGLSMGATTVLMSCGEPFAENVRGVIADCGFTMPHDIMTSVVRSMHLPAKLIVPLIGMQTKLFAGFGLREYSTVEAMRRMTLPIFFAHGEADTFVPCRMSVEAYEACQSKDKALLLVPNAAHGKSFPRAPEKYRACLNELFDRALS